MAKTHTTHKQLCLYLRHLAAKYRGFGRGDLLNLKNILWTLKFLNEK